MNQGRNAPSTSPWDARDVVTTPIVSPELRESTWDASVFVWTVWAVMLMAAYWFVGKFGSAAFFQDDWVFVPVLTGQEPLTLQWLWAQNNEHRLPLTNLIIWALYNMFDFDARSGMYLTVTLLGLLAVVMIRSATHLRGQIRYADAFFPVVLLQWGQYDNLLLGHQVYQSVPVFLAGALLCLIVCHGTKMTLGITALAGTCLLALGLCGSMGIVFAPFLACWFLAFPFVVLRHRPAASSIDERIPLESSSHLTTGSAVVIAVLALALAGFYFVGFKDSYFVEGHEFLYHPASPNLRATVVTAAKFLSMGFGYLGPILWKASGIAMAGLLVSSALAIQIVGVYRPIERLRALGLMCFLAALAALAVGIGLGRAGMGTDMGFSSRYVTLAALAVCSVYFIWGIVGGGIGRLVQMMLFTTACGALIINAGTGLGMGARHQKFMQAFETDVREGTPPVVIAARHTIGEYPIYTCRVLRNEKSLQDEFVKLMHMGHNKGKGLLRQLNEAPLTEVRLASVSPFRANQITWTADGAAECLGNDPYMVFALEGPREVTAIRIKYSMAGPPPPAHLQAYWRNGDAQNFSETERYYQTDLPPDLEEKIIVERAHAAGSVWLEQTGGGPQTQFWVTIPVNDTIDQFRIDPNDQPCRFKIEEIRLVVPVRG
jgi:hypothetical protein